LLTNAAISTNVSSNQKTQDMAKEFTSTQSIIESNNELFGSICKKIAELVNGEVSGPHVTSSILKKLYSWSRIKASKDYQAIGCEVNHLDGEFVLYIINHNTKLHRFDLFYNMSEGISDENIAEMAEITKNWIHNGEYPVTKVGQE